MCQLLAAVESRTISIPLRKPLSFSTRFVERREYTLVRVRTAENLEGVGYCYCGNRAGHLVTQFVREHVLKLLARRVGHERFRQDDSRS